MSSKIVRIDLTHLDALEKTKNFPLLEKKQGGVESEFDIGGAVDTALKFFIETRKFILARMKGYFTREELTAIIASYNGSMFDFQFATNKKTFVWHIEDSIKLEDIATMYGCNADLLLQKSQNLTDLECLVLQQEISLFWDAQRDLEEFINLFF